MRSKTGVLLHISSLPNGYGIGNFGQAAYEFVDFLTATNQRYWQILPLNPIGYGYSPYQTVSTFAINPYFIDLDEFVKLNILSPEDLKNGLSSTRKVDYLKTITFCDKVFKKAFAKGYELLKSEIESFVKDNSWLEDYARFMALKEVNANVSFQNFDNQITTPQSQQYYYFLQYFAYNQYKSLKSYANFKGIKIIGDVPIYVSEDSADVWSNPHEFLLDKKGFPTQRAGVPPDYFSADGQFWGNPLYNYKKMRQSNFSWWRTRLTHALELYDIIRIDHFRGFVAYWSVFGSTAKEGKWVKGVGHELLASMQDFLYPSRVIAEDLGVITPAVEKLRKDYNFMGMKVLQFAFAKRNNRHKYLPHNYPEDCAAYTGTHDNDTLASFIRKDNEEVANAKRYYKTCNSLLLHDIMLRSLVESKAKIVILPAQDILGLVAGRMNTPSTIGGNWKFRLLPQELEKKIDYLKDITN